MSSTTWKPLVKKIKYQHICPKGALIYYDVIFKRLTEKKDRKIKTVTYKFCPYCGADLTPPEQGNQGD